MDAGEKIKEYAKHLLSDLMSEISEDHYAAGWMHDLEYDLWHIVQGANPGYGMYPVEPEVIEQLKTLSADAGGWFIYKDGRKFISLEEWLPVYEAHVASQKAKGYWK